MNLDDLADSSLAYREFLAQLASADELDEDPADRSVSLLTGDDSGPLVFDLAAIHRAALDDPECEHICQRSSTEAARRWLTPRRFVSFWLDATDAYEMADDGRVLVDRSIAFDYMIKRDERVMDAVIEEHIEKRKAAARVDPIGNAVRSAAGGGFGMMFARLDAMHLGMDDRAFADAVMGRAEEEAESLDHYAAEKLLSQVRQALEGSPAIQYVHGGEEGNS